MAQLKKNDIVYVTSAKKDGDSYAVDIGYITSIDENHINISLRRPESYTVDDHLMETFAPLSNSK